MVVLNDVENRGLGAKAPRRIEEDCILSTIPRSRLIPGRGPPLTLIDRERLRGNYQGLIERLRDKPEEGFRRVGVDARITQDVTVEVTFEQYDREWSLIGDEAVSRGGHEQGPSPLRYFMSGIAICQLGWWAKGAATLGCDVENFTVGVRTFLDMRGEHGFGDHPTYPQWFALHVDIAGWSTPEQ